MYLYRGENFGETHADELAFEYGHWSFGIEGAGFEARLGFHLARVPETTWRLEGSEDTRSY